MFFVYEVLCVPSDGIVFCVPGVSGRLCVSRVFDVHGFLCIPGVAIEANRRKQL